MSCRDGGFPQGRLDGTTVVELLTVGLQKYDGTTGDGGSQRWNDTTSYGVTVDLHDSSALAIRQVIVLLVMIQRW